MTVSSSSSSSPSTSPQWWTLQTSSPLNFNLNLKRRTPPKKHASPSLAGFSNMSRNVRRSHFFSTVRVFHSFSYILFCPHYLATAFLRELSMIQEVGLLLEGFAAFLATEHLLKFWHFVHPFPVYGEDTFRPAFLPAILADKSHWNFHFLISFQLTPCPLVVIVVFCRFSVHPPIHWSIMLKLKIQNIHFQPCPSVHGELHVICFLLSVAGFVHMSFVASVDP